MLPWHSVAKENKSRIQAESRTPKWQQTHDDIPSKSNTEGWSSWRKTPGSEIEQRTQTDIRDYVSERTPEPVPEQVSEQPRDFEFDTPQQQENPKSPLEHGELINNKDRGGFKNEPNYGDRGRPQNAIDFEPKQPPGASDTKETYVEFEDLYEGVSPDSTVIVLNHLNQNFSIR